jgi:hypothetical protein
METAGNLPGITPPMAGVPATVKSISIVE